VSNLPRKNVDPYRELGVARGASNAEIKKAHRALAKRFHPDAAGGDTVRFLAIQEAYLLLADPLRRRDWDTRHAPGPVRANEPRRPRPRGADGRWTREEGTPSAGRQRSPTSRRPRQTEPAHGAGPSEPRQATWSGSDRPSGSRSYRWSAENVPWWEDFAPRKSGGGAGTNGAGSKADGSAGADSAGAGSAGTATSGARAGRQAKAGKPQEPGTGASDLHGPDPKSEPQGHSPKRGPTRTGSEPHTQPSAPHGQMGNEFDVYSRSSGAAWSSAARQYFRKASEDLPSRGSFVYRGTQVVTGATARKVAEELLRQRPGVGPAPRQAFEPHDRPGATASRPAEASGGAPAASQRANDSVHGAGTSGMSGRPTAWSRPEPEDDPGAPPSSQPGVLATAAVGGVGGLIVTLPALALGMTVLNPPLQPAFAVLLLVLAAIAGALAATFWMRLRS
jgi:curved DNA-binding protein CbpA